MKSNQQNKPAIIYQSLYLANLLFCPALYTIRHSVITIMSASILSGFF
ncbi:MAG: hypothetical protein JKX67_12260 [Colwellia sp.]|nr:hypothetical protein [Colwellia sp.]